jgi:hypothetical protein
MSLDGTPDSSVSLDGLPPGTTVFDSVAVQPGDSAVIDIQFAFTKRGDADISELMLRWDDDGDGEVEDALSVPLIGGWLCGDADASGGVDIDDVVFLIDYVFSGGDAPEC